MLSEKEALQHQLLLTAKLYTISHELCGGQCAEYDRLFSEVSFYFAVDLRWIKNFRSISLWNNSKDSKLRIPQEGSHGYIPRETCTTRPVHSTNLQVKLSCFFKLKLKFVALNLISNIL